MSYTEKSTVCKTANFRYALRRNVVRDKAEVKKLLTELSIRNFAIIDDISVSFHDGLTVLTGETGAGKSIIIDAVQLLTGSRGSVDFVRHNEEKAEIIGQFSLKANAPKIKKNMSAICHRYRRRYTYFRKNNYEYR